MKCPYRKKVIHKNTSDNEEFMDCYGTECPFWSTRTYSNGDLVYECKKCKKVESEYFHATHLGGRQ